MGGRLTAVLAALITGAAGAARAQNDTTPLAAADFPIKGSARVNFDGQLVATDCCFLVANQLWYPFVGERWQVGAAFSESWLRVPGRSLSPAGETASWYSGGVTLVANYLFAGRGRSRGYYGGYLSRTGASNVPANGAYGAQLGWLYFVSPVLGVRSQLNVREALRGPGRNTTDLLVGLEPYLAGRRASRLPERGTVDLVAIADYVYEPGNHLDVWVRLAPYLTRWLQTGGEGTYYFYFTQNGGSRSGELFVRAYAPWSPRFSPFAEGFFTGSKADARFPGTSAAGARLGARTFLGVGVPFDLALEVRNRQPYVAVDQTVRQRSVFSIRAATYAQFRIAR